ncbi:MAG: PAS domain S-box protein [Sedimentisphaerales bacterium]|nr:PAS domain S-box protein [Sedimentisphaerales bacterium]
MSEENKHGEASERTDPVPDRYYRNLCDCSSFAIVGTDCQGRIISWNQAAEILFNTPAAQIVGCHLERIVPEGLRSQLHEAIETAINRQEQNEFEVNHRDEQGESMTLAMVISPVLETPDKVVGVAAWVRDISNRKILETQLLQAEKMASLGTLASGVAHHFNNIIGGVATFVDFALQSRNAESTMRALHMTAEAANRISQITSSLLTFAEKDARQFDLSDLTEIILTFAHLVEKPLSEKNIKLELRLQAVPVFEVPGSRIHKVLGNLLDNAEIAMPDGGTVTIGLHRDNHNLVMTFSDTGAGIDAQHLPHIFEPFFTTLGVASGGNRNSSGLGLAVVHGIIRELGGTVNVKSRLKRGTTFIISFPARG